NEDTDPSEVNKTVYGWDEMKNASIHPGPYHAGTMPFTISSCLTYSLSFSTRSLRSCKNAAACISTTLLLYPPSLSSGTSEHNSLNPWRMRSRRFCSDRMWFSRFCSSVRLSLLPPPFFLRLGG